jgi:hypothetical protein
MHSCELLWKLGEHRALAPTVAQKTSGCFRVLRAGLNVVIRTSHYELNLSLLHTQRQWNCLWRELLKAPLLGAEAVTRRRRAAPLAELL